MPVPDPWRMIKLKIMNRKSVCPFVRSAHNSTPLVEEQHTAQHPWSSSSNGIGIGQGEVGMGGLQVQFLVTGDDEVGSIFQRSEFRRYRFPSFPTHDHGILDLCVLFARIRNGTSSELGCRCRGDSGSDYSKRSVTCLGPSGSRRGTINVRRKTKVGELTFCEIFHLAWKTPWKGPIKSNPIGFRSCYYRRQAVG
jgi:hypothetical protein